MTPNDKYLYRKLLAEFLGTAYLVMTIALAQGYNEAVPAIIISVTISTGMISGAFYNPAVALGALIKSYLQKDIDWPMIRLYICIIGLEFLGATTGAFYAYAISGGTFKLTKNSECSTGGAFLAEVMGATQLVAMAMMVPEHYPHIIVAVFCVAGSVLATIQWDTSGAVMNPALGFGVKLVDAAKHGSERFDNLWIYLTAPFVGAVLGTLINAIYLVEVRRRREEKSKNLAKKTDSIPMESSDSLISDEERKYKEGINTRKAEALRPLESR
mmetsp:Transcript_34463/g.60480  ORF Transcript_34463/g.60480 Transcript_34463/m.60480 type:complete len:271 (-) Transcript_34463:26-838(-)